MKECIEFFISWPCFAQIPGKSGHEMKESPCFFISWQQQGLATPLIYKQKNRRRVLRREVYGVLLNDVW